MLPEHIYRITTYGFILINFSVLITGSGSFTYTVDNSLKSFRSPHVLGSTGKDFTYYLRSELHHGSVFIRVFFPKLNPLPYHICIDSYIDIYDSDTTGFPILGRYCDMNSTLIRSTGDHLTVMSTTSGSSFDFELYYCLRPFNNTDTMKLFPTNSSKDSVQGLSALKVAGICAGVFLTFFILGCLMIKYCDSCRRSSARDPATDPVSISTNADETSTVNPFGNNTPSRLGRQSRFAVDQPDNLNAVSCGGQRDSHFAFTRSSHYNTTGHDMNVQYTPDPPDYWSVAGHHYSNKDTVGDVKPEDPPSYSEAVSTAYPL